MNLSRTGRWRRFSLFGICVLLALTPGLICRAPTQLDHQTVEAVFRPGGGPSAVSLFGICVLLALTPGLICRAPTQLDHQTVEAVFQAIEDNDIHALQVIYASNTNCVADDYYGV